MEIYKIYKYRLYPTVKQKEMLEKTFGNNRFVYNYFLTLRKETYVQTKKDLNSRTMQKLLTELKRDSNYAWLRETDSMAYQETIKNLDKAYKLFFEGVTNYPILKSKRSKQSYRTRNVENVIHVVDKKHINIPKIGKLKFIYSRNINGRILNATIRKTLTNKYYINLCVKEEIETKKINTNKEQEKKKIGIDLGTRNLYTDSNGNKCCNPKFIKKYEKKLKRANRKLSKKYESAKKDFCKSCTNISYQEFLKNRKNIDKQRIFVAKVYEKIDNCRNDFLQKETTKLIRENQIIGIENLDVKKLLHQKQISKFIADASWNRFCQLLVEKGESNNVVVKQVPTTFPSSQLCSSCGCKNIALKNIAIKKWKCPVCGENHQRDINAAKNILNYVLTT